MISEKKFEIRQRYKKRRNRLRKVKRLALYTIYDTIDGKPKFVKYLCTYLHKDHQKKSSSGYVCVLYRVLLRDRKFSLLISRYEFSSILRN